MFEEEMILIICRSKKHPIKENTVQEQPVINADYVFTNTLKREE